MYFILLLLATVEAAPNGLSMNENSEVFVVSMRQCLHKDGAYYILDVREEEVMVVTAEGDLIRRFGRAGQGPGEFSRPSNLFFSGDDLYVFNSGNGALQRYNQEGQHLGTIQLERAPLSLYTAGGLFLVTPMKSYLFARYDLSGEKQSFFGKGMNNQLDPTKLNSLMVFTAYDEQSRTLYTIPLSGERLDTYKGLNDWRESSVEIDLNEYYALNTRLESKKTSSGGMTMKLQTGLPVENIAFSSGRLLVLLKDENTKERLLLTLDPETGRTLEREPAPIDANAMSQDGSRLFFFNADTSELKEFTHDVGDGSGASELGR